MNGTYVITNSDYVLTGFHEWQPLIRDGAYDGRMELLASVRSGDYFALLATQLDKLGDELSDESVRAQIDKLVADLLFLNDSFEIKRKNKR